MSTQLLVASRSSEFVYITKVESRVFAIVLLSLLLRNMMLEDWNYLFLIWNLLLAYIPLLLFKLSQKQVAIGSKYWYAIVAAWALFLPNAPYIVTDLIHPITAFQKGLVLGLPLGVLSVLAAAILGMLWFLRSLHHFNDQLDQLGFSEHLRRGITALLVLATAAGIWMGRVLRFNTWDVLTKPWDVVSNSSHLITTPLYAEWILVSALLLWSSWRAYERWSWIGEVVE